jgi:hypothetical protein
MVDGLSVLIPHYSTPDTDIALQLCISMFRENTVCRNYELIIVQGFTDPYAFWNRYSDHARYEALVFYNNDMLPAPAWDTLMLKHLDDNSLIMGYLLEPGVIQPARQNIHKDFGRSPKTFRREDFERFCSQVDIPERVDEMGWYMPVMLTRTFFNRMGKYPTQKPFPHPNDAAFWDTCTRKGARLVRVRSFSYHFQGMSNPANDKFR